MAKMVVSIMGKESPVPVAPIQLYLEQSRDDVHLRAIDGSGNEWFIITVTPEGLRIWRDLPTATGWPLDKYSRIKMVDDTTGEPIE